MLAAAGLAGFGPAFAQAPAPEETDHAEPPAEVATGSSRWSHVTAPVTLNGQGPFAFIVDTGANRSCISLDLARKLALPPGPAVAVNTAAGRRMRETVTIERLSVGPRSQRRVNVPVLPISGGIAGVLAVDWLKGQRLVLGLRDHRLEITSPRTERSRPNSVVVPARRRQGQLTIIDADVNGERISAMIDSGAQVTMGNLALRQMAMRSGRAAEPPQEVQMQSIAGERFTGEQLHLSFVRLGGLHLGNVPVVFSEMHVFKLWDLAATPTLLLGMDLLTQFTEVAVDFGRATVRFDFLEGQAG